MDSLSLVEIALIVGCAVGGAGVIWWVSLILDRQAKIVRAETEKSPEPVFLFDGETLVDASLEAQKMLKNAAKHLSDRQAIINLFQDRFPTLDMVMTNLVPGTREELMAADVATMSLQVEDVDGMTRLTLCGANAEDNQSLGDTVATEAAQRELYFLRDIVDASPHMMWVQNLDGQMTWANRAYLNLSDRIIGRQTGVGRNWPDKSIFPDLHLGVEDSKTLDRRAEAQDPNSDAPLAFDVTSWKQGKNIMHFASNADAVVAAERSKGRAVQTMSQLFGDISSGLALFDQNQRLTMFNPGVVSMTNLSPNFLMGRPTLIMFLDALRDNGTMPEPKNYASWKERFKSFEAAALRGDLREVWTINDNKTLRITARSYSEGACAFFLEDISASVALLRRSQAEIQTTRGVLDAQKHAIAVFSADGSLKCVNKAYQNLWHCAPDTTLEDQQLRNEITRWQENCAAAPSWNDLRAFVAGTVRGEPWVDHAILEDGRHIRCEAQPINGLHTLVSFFIDTPEQKMNPIIHKLTMADPGIQSAKG